MSIFEKHGLENLNVIDNRKESTITDHDVLLKLKQQLWIYGLCLVSRMFAKSRPSTHICQEQKQVTQ